MQVQHQQRVGTCLTLLRSERFKRGSALVEKLDHSHSNGLTEFNQGERGTGSPWEHVFLPKTVEGKPCV